MKVPSGAGCGCCGWDVAERLHNVAGGTVRGNRWSLCFGLRTAVGEAGELKVAGDGVAIRRASAAWPSSSQVGVKLLRTAEKHNVITRRKSTMKCPEDAELLKSSKPYRRVLKDRCVLGSGIPHAARYFVPGHSHLLHCPVGRFLLSHCLWCSNHLSLSLSNAC